MLSEINADLNKFALTSRSVIFRDLYWSHTHFGKQQLSLSFLFFLLCWHILIFLCLV